MSKRKERSQPQIRPVPPPPDPAPQPGMAVDHDRVAVASSGDPRSELSRKTLLGRAAMLAGGAFAVGLPSSALAKPASGEGVSWNAGAGRFEASFVTTAPATAAENTIEPTADVPALTLQGLNNHTAALLKMVGANAYETARLEWPTVDSGYAPFAIAQGRGEFTGVPDPLFLIGYNTPGTTGGAKIVAGEPSIKLAWEADYFHDGIHDWEWYLEVVNEGSTKNSRPIGATGRRDGATNAEVCRDAGFTAAAIYFNYPGEASQIQMMKVLPGQVLLYPDLAGTDGNMVINAGGAGAASIDLHAQNSVAGRIEGYPGGVSGGFSFRCGSSYTYVMDIAPARINIFDGKNIQVGTTTGTEIGTATTQKLGFFGATPVVQPPSHGGQTAGAGYGTRERNMLNDVYAGLRALGLLA